MKNPIRKQLSRVLKKPRYPFLILWVFSFTIIFIPGHLTVKSYYENPFPRITNYEFPIKMSEEGDPGKLKPSISLSCDSYYGYEVPVVGDEFVCSISFTDYSGFGKFGEIHLNGSPILVNYNPVTNEATEVNAYNRHILIATLEGLDDYENTTGFNIPRMNFPIQNEGINRFALRIPFTDKENTSFTLETSYIPYLAFSLQDYRKTKTEKMGLYVSLITLSIFISLSGIKNLMDIWYKK